MSLHIRNPEADALMNGLMAMGETSKTDVIIRALQDYTKKKVFGQPQRDTWDIELDALIDEINSLPLLDDREPDEILGYNAQGLPE